MYRTFEIVRHRGRQNKAQFEYNGRTYKVNRLPALLWDGKPFACEQYDDHFIFQVPQEVLGPSFQCTCGSMAVIPSEDWLPVKWACYHFLTYGCHANLQTRWI